MNILCKHGFHKFEPRYNVIDGELCQRVEYVKGVSLHDLKDKIYVGDVCRRCGEVKNGSNTKSV